MKPFKKIIILGSIVTGIVLFWLMPNVNKAKDVRYTRMYEDTYKNEKDTSRHRAIRFKAKNKAVDSTKIIFGKTYKTESIRSNAKFSDIKPSMFSRAVQFNENVKVVEIDTFENVTLAKIDTIEQKQ